MTRKRKKSWSRKTARELDHETSEFNQEFVVDTFAPMTAKDRTEWERMKKKRGRPQIGKGAKVIAVSLERGLLAQCDRLAKKKGVSRAQLISRGLKAILGRERVG